MSSEIGRDMIVYFSERASQAQAKILMAKPNEPDMLPYRTKQGAIRYLTYSVSAK